MSMSVCVVDPTGDAEEVREWSFMEDRAIVTGGLGGPGVVDVLKERPDPGARVLILHRRQEHHDAAFVANVVSGALPRVAVARLEVGSSLLAATIIALEAARVEGDGDVARLSRIGRTVDKTTSGIWVRRVTRLTTPSPTFGQHLRSLFPGGAGFVGLCGTTPRTVKAEPGGYGVGGTRGRIVVGAAEGDRGVDQLLEWFGGEDTVLVPPVMASVRSGYGNAGHEFAVVDEILAPPAAHTGQCPVCRESLHQTSCPFCHARPDPLEVSPA